MSLMIKLLFGTLALYLAVASCVAAGGYASGRP